MKNKYQLVKRLCMAVGEKLEALESNIDEGFIHFLDGMILGILYCLGKEDEYLDAEDPIEYIDNYIGEALEELESMTEEELKSYMG